MYMYCAAALKSVHFDVKKVKSALIFDIFNHSQISISDQSCITLELATFEFIYFREGSRA